MENQVMFFGWSVIWRCFQFLIYFMSDLRDKNYRYTNMFSNYWAFLFCLFAICRQGMRQERRDRPYWSSCHKTSTSGACRSSHHVIKHELSHRKLSALPLLTLFVIICFKWRWSVRSCSWNKVVCWTVLRAIYFSDYV